MRKDLLLSILKLNSVKDILIECVVIKEKSVCSRILEGKRGRGGEYRVLVCFGCWKSIRNWHLLGADRDSIQCSLTDVTLIYSFTFIQQYTYIIYLFKAISK